MNPPQPLIPFYCKINAISNAQEPRGDKFHAYNMDGQFVKGKDMRVDARLGSINCCDYFRPANDAVILIEEMNLVNEKNTLMQEFHDMDDKDKIKYAISRLKEKGRLKVYGSLFMLCRLASLNSSRLQRAVKKELTSCDVYKFWLVLTGNTDNSDIRIFDNLESDLRSLLSIEAMPQVKVLRPDDLKTMLTEE